MKSLEELKEKLYIELDKIVEKGELSAGSLDMVHKVTDTIKNIDKIERLEGEEYSYDGGMSYRDGRRASYEIRGSYGEGRYNRGGSYDDGGSYANRGKHYVRGHYSRDDGKEYMMEHMEKAMYSAGSEKEREAIRRCMGQLENA